MEPPDGPGTSGQETPVVATLSSSIQLPERTNCLACSADGCYLALGHARGLSVCCAAELSCVADWLEERLEITDIQMINMADAAYLLGSIDDMGVARVFAYHAEKIHLIRVINSMEDINRRSVCLKFEVSERGNYGAAFIKCNEDVWLEVYNFPSESWLRQLEEAPEQGNIRWFPIPATARIKRPNIPTVLAGSMKLSDILTPCLVLDEMSDSPRHGTHHFLLPCGQCPVDTPALPDGVPAAVCLWWSGDHNLLQYSLSTPKNRLEIGSGPDVLCPNASEIICSAVSRCTRFIALGLSSAVVCVWDRLSGSPLAVVAVAADSAFLRLQFVDYWPASADDPTAFIRAETHLTMVCKSGEIHTLTARRGAKPSIAQLTESPANRGDMPTVTASVPSLQGLSLVVHRNGKMFLQDVINKTSVCALSLPKTHLLATPCSPVYAVNTRDQILYVRGDRDRTFSRSSAEGSQLFLLSFKEEKATHPYVVSHQVSPLQLKALSFAALEEDCNLYLQQRVLSMEERQQAVKKTWKHLQEAAVVVEQRHGSPASS